MATRTHARTSPTSLLASPLTIQRFWMLLGALIAWLALMSIVPTMIAHAMGYTGARQLFALSNAPTYTPAQAHAVLAAYGSSGRLAYAVSLGLFDIVFPILYGSLLSVGLRLVTRGMRLSPRAQHIAGYAPYIACVANWMADVCILALLLGFPSQLTPLAVVAAAMTMVKFLVIGLSAISLLVGGLIALARRAMRQTAHSRVAVHGGE